MTIRQRAHAYAAPQNGVAVANLILSAALYFGAITVGGVYWGNPIIVTLAVIVFIGGCIRFFGAQHDCGHYAHFSNRQASEVVGVILGAFTAHPFYAMQYNHNRHHAHIGNLDERDAHEVLTWTVAEYQNASFWGRFLYRAYRSVFVIYFLGPVFIFFIRYRIPKNVQKTGWADVVMQNGLMALLWYGVYTVGGPTAFVFFIIANICAACFGTFMVFAGHNFEEAYWEHTADVDLEDASLRGSSVLDFGPVFHFLTYNFAYHDLHHLYVKIPAYRLGACHEALRNELQPTRMGWGEAIACIRWKLWDEDSKRMVRFQDVEAPRMMHPTE